MTAEVKKLLPEENLHPGVTAHGVKPLNFIEFLEAAKGWDCSGPHQPGDAGIREINEDD